MDLKVGDIISHAQMCLKEGVSLQRGMNFRIKGNASTIILMSLRKGAPYVDKIEDNGKILIYEGHDQPKNEAEFPKLVDQPFKTRTGLLTQNGKFYEAAIAYKQGESQPELVKVYEKIKDGIRVYNGVFELIDAVIIKVKKRKVFKFTLKISDKDFIQANYEYLNTGELDHNRIIPTSVKLEVWQRDKGKCTQCGSIDNLHFDHIIPFSKGGTSLKVENIQLLCARHNLKKRDKIE